MKIVEAVERTRDAMTVKRVFGDAYEKDGVTVIPAAWVAGGGGGGFGLAAFPVGAYIIKDGEVTWRPAVNVTFVVVAGLFVFRSSVRAWAKRNR